MVQKTLAQLKKELAIQRNIAEKARIQAELNLEKRKIRFELAKARNPGFFRAGQVISKGAKRLGKGIIRQGQLIKLQQEREEKERRTFSKAVRKSTVIKKRPKRIVKRRVKKRRSFKKSKSKKQSFTISLN